MGYYRAGFEVVGVDIKSQPRYPFEFHQADALTYPLEGFDAYHASSPCQYYTRLRHLPWLKDRIYWRSVPPTITRLKEVWDKPCIIENVEDCWDMPDSFILCGFSLGLDLYRHRRFLTNFPIFQPSHQKYTKVIAPGRAILSKRHHGNQGFREISRNTLAGHFSGVDKAREVMGIDWMTQTELAQAIPPAYTEYIGKYLLAEIRKRVNEVQVRME
uniref:Putative methyltransferase n=1 Tax=viral metagenome TaxID=1070528 RepID=A0A6M3KM54_9ZZZZ